MDTQFFLELPCRGNANRFEELEVQAENQDDELRCWPRQSGGEVYDTNEDAKMEAGQ